MTRGSRIAAALLLAGIAGAAHAAEPANGYGPQVVGLTVTYQPWDQDRPWARRAPQTRRAAAIVVEGPYLLTTAQIVSDATFLQAEKNGRSPGTAARVVRTDPEIDLALVAVDDPAFFEGLRPAALASGSPAEGIVRTVRWKNRQLEVSEGRIARTEVQWSVFATVQHPFLLVASDLTAGGWSEPVFSGPALVGLTASQDERLARVIPVEILATFLAQARSGETYRGFAALGLSWQVNEDPVVARWLGLPGEPRGVLVTAVPYGGSGCGVILPRDLLLSVGGLTVDGSGSVDHPRWGRQPFPFLAVDGRAPGDSLPVQVWRDGQLLDLSVTLRAADASLDLIPERRADGPPAYAVIGGLVFRELDGPYLRTWGEDWRKKAPVSLVTRFHVESEEQSPERRRVLLLSRVLPHAYNLGYHTLSDLRVRRINGQPIDAVSDVVDAFARPQGDVHRIELEPNPAQAEVILDAATLEAADAEILEAYGIPQAVRPESPRPDAGPACGG